MAEDKTEMFAELWGHVYDKSGWFRIATDATIFKQSFDSEDDAWRAQESINNLKKSSMSLYAHALHPIFDEIDICYFVYDPEDFDGMTPVIGEDCSCEILWLDEARTAC